MAATSTWRFTALLHPRFLECVGVLGVAVFVRALVRERAARPALRSLAIVARDFAPFFLILLLYETLHDLTPLLRPHVVDATLAAIDRALFGVDVAFWMGRFATPLLTRVLVL